MLSNLKIHFCQSQLIICAYMLVCQMVTVAEFECNDIINTVNTKCNSQTTTWLNGIKVFSRMLTVDLIHHSVTDTQTVSSHTWVRPKHDAVLLFQTRYVHALVQAECAHVRLPVAPTPISVCQLCHIYYMQHVYQCYHVNHNRITIYSNTTNIGAQTSFIHLIRQRL